jgi:hypothetical protein
LDVENYLCDSRFERQFGRTEEYDVEAAISSMSRSHESIVRAKVLLESILSKFTCDKESCEMLICTLISKASNVTLQFLCLLLSFEENFDEIKTTEADSLKSSDFKKNMLVVKGSGGRVLVHRLVKTGGEAVCGLLRKIFEGDSNELVLDMFKRLISDGDEALKLSTKKKKTKGFTDFDKLKAQADIVVKVFLFN